MGDVAVGRGRGGGALMGLRWGLWVWSCPGVGDTQRWFNILGGGGLGLGTSEPGQFPPSGQRGGAGNAPIPILAPIPVAEPGQSAAPPASISPPVGINTCPSSPLHYQRVNHHVKMTAIGFLGRRPFLQPGPPRAVSLRVAGKGAPGAAAFLLHPNVTTPLLPALSPPGRGGRVPH